MRIFPVLLAAAIPVAAYSQPATSTGRLSGAQAVERWVGKNKLESTSAELYAIQFVDGYLAGVTDLTEGTVWCNKQKIKMHEIDADVLWALKDLPADRAQRTSAAKLAVEILAKKYPCGVAP